MTQDPTFESRLGEAVKALDAMRDAIGRALVGQRDIIDQTLIALLAGGHVLIEGVPGLGKTLLVKALAKTFNGDFRRIQFTPDLMPSDVTGHTLYDPATGKFSTRKGPVFTHLLLADEINRAPAKTQAALLEVMQERQVTIEGEAHLLDAPFMVLATENPIDQEGTYPLPEAQLDRFLLKIRIDYPTLDEETRLVKQVTNGAVGEQLDVNVVPTLIKPATVLALQEMAARIILDDRVLDYAVRLTRATREFPRLASGAGPRGAIALVRAGRACALLAGRTFVTPDDIKQIALPTLRHRVIPAPEAEIEGTDADRLLQQLLIEVEAPRQ
ncbi:MoxR family ATPase [Chitinivorax sp. B]|uniref:AAA family ATPase n=1 Tax=Chitinivorax sp. B TaxID=2502235 RepID=UPI0010F76389|nr:MoxR family ATPase [Chitinivorax sp. B]